MKLLVTGCFGFIGYNFIQNLDNNFMITGLDSLESNSSRTNKNLFKNKNNFKFIQKNINDLEVEDLKNIDIVINFAAESHVDNSIFDPGIFVDSNVKGVSNLLKCAISSNVQKFIHISTDEVYGSSTTKFNTENDYFNPSSPYSASKASAELFINSFQKTFGYKCITLRPANNYGIFQQPEKLIPFSIANLILGKNIELYGNGFNIRHWLHVEDTTSAILHILQNGTLGEVYNIGSDEYLTNLEVAKYILDATKNSEERLEFVSDRPGHDFRYAIDFTKLKKLEWKPKKIFSEEIENIVEWYINNKSWWLTDFQNIIQNKRKKRFGES